MVLRHIIGLSTKGSGSNEEDRLRALLSGHDAELFPFSYSSKLRSAWNLLKKVSREKPGLLVIEGTGIAGGAVCMLARLLFGTKYVVSSGDAVSPFLRARIPWLLPLTALYERMLCRFAAGFIGWTPYLVGRALTFGTPRAMTAPGWCDFASVADFKDHLARRRREIRAELGIADETIVIGIAGWLYWSKRYSACYGSELVRAIQEIGRQDIAVLIVGEGTGRPHLEKLAGERLGKSVFFTGQVPGASVPEYLAAMDVGSLPQSVDGVGSFRYTTKISEYVACSLPFITNQIPLSYDFGTNYLWRIQGDSPWDPVFLGAVARWMEQLTWDQVHAKRGAIPLDRGRFDKASQIAAATDFFSDLMDPSPGTFKSSPAAVPAPPIVRTPNARAAPRRLLSIAHSYAVGVNRRLAHEMSMVGAGQWEVTAVAPRYFHGSGDLRPVTFTSSGPEPCRVEVVPAHMTRVVHLFTYGNRLKSIMQEPWDLIHAWEEPYIVVGYQIARWAKPGVPLVYRTAQSLSKHYPPPFNWIETHNMTRAAGWICSGQLVAETLGARQLYQRRPVCRIPLGVDLDFYKPQEAAREQTLKELEWNRSDPPVIGYIGRFVTAKGLKLLTEVFDELNTPWRALFVGAGPMESYLRRWAQRYGPRVRICTGVHHKDVPRFLSVMNVLCAPSQTKRNWREQFGRMLIEAFAAGVPVVGSDSGEIPYVIGDAGVVCGERDHHAWVRELRALLDSPSRRSELAEKGLQLAHEHYAWPIVARQYLEFFDELTCLKQSAYPSVQSMEDNDPSR